jgi:hypothetical protein
VIVSAIIGKEVHTNMCVTIGIGLFEYGAQCSLDLFVGLGEE